ncbi:serine/arginine-rich splicing factor 4-like [Drosophila guanche]|uniref:Blast:RNA-binding protein with serine-rich domain 1 n=1 Tax=Drosophila guanche TaxID=7266 RepID=A0A3B0K8E7_DROGU|nr:serine/arginine-rich splicing factor 4-like [Drosophila guanche]SPP82319.1 blast:RNA-binding protein with serine-rich domain 1 [Drosophila guanche]
MVEQMEATTNSGGNVPITGKAPSVPSKASNESDMKDDSLKPSKRDKSGKLHKSRDGHKSSSKAKKFKTSSPLRSQSESSMSSISMGYNESDLSSSSDSGDSSRSNEKSFDHRCCHRRLHRRARYGKPSSHHRRRSEHSTYSKRRHPQPVPPPETEIENFDKSDSEDKPRRKKRGNRKEFKDVACQTSPLKKTSKPTTAGTSSSSGSGSGATVKTASHASNIEASGSSSKVEHKQDPTGSTGGSSANSKAKSSSSNVKSIVFSVSSKPIDPVKLKRDSTKTVEEETKYSKPNDSGHIPKQPIVVSSSTAKLADTSGSKTHTIPAAPPAIPKLPAANSNDKVTANAGASQLPPKSEIMQRSIRTRSRSSSRSRTRSRSRSRSGSRSRSRSHSHSRLRSRSRSKSRSPRNNRRRVTSPNSAIDRAMGNFRTGAPPISHVRLHIKGLSRQVTKEHVTEIFGSFGPLTAVDFPVELEANDGTGRGFAFVEYANPQDCARAIKNMDGGQIDSRRIVVSAFRPNKVRAAWRRRYSPVQSGIRQRSRSRSHNRNNFESRFRDRSRSQFRGQYRAHQPRGYHY